MFDKSQTLSGARKYVFLSVVLHSVPSATSIFSLSNLQLLTRLSSLEAFTEINCLTGTAQSKIMGLTLKVPT